MGKQNIVLSNLNHTWFIDLDGTVFKHNGYKIDGHDTLLPVVKEFLSSIPEKDLIVIVTSRTDDYRELTLKALKENYNIDAEIQIVAESEHFALINLTQVNRED